MPNSNLNSTHAINNIDSIKNVIKNIEDEALSPTAPATAAASFSMFDFPEALTHTLLHMKYEVPTGIQLKAIPLILNGSDILGSAATGSGKTGAFSIPLVAKLLNSSNESVLVLTPTRELASQVLSIFHQLLGKKSKINTALLIGGDPIVKQFRQLQASPRVIVGTPGRVNDHLIRRTLNLQNTKYLVLDETDRMLDMGFDVQIKEIIRQTPKERQTLMFSATIANRIATLSKEYLTNPQRVDCGASNLPAPKIKQENIHTSQKAKYENLIQELGKRTGSVIIFAKTKRDTDELARRLREDGHRADAIHGDLQQRRRERVVSDYRLKKFRILVATDVASRGLDIPHIEHVINFDLPHCPEDYIHRIGRTARAGAEGAALNLISPEDDKKWRAINQLMNPGSHRNDRDGDRSSRAPRRGGYSGNRSNSGGGNGGGGGHRAFQGYSSNGASSQGGGGYGGGRSSANTGSSAADGGDRRKKYGNSNGASNTGGYAGSREGNGASSGRRTFTNNNANSSNSRDSGGARKSAPFFPQRKDSNPHAGRSSNRTYKENA